MKARDGSKTAVSLPRAPDAAPPASWVENRLGVCGGDARIRQTRITVWGLVERRMTRVITTETVVALLQCPRKAHLLLHSPDQGSAHPYHAMLDRHAEETRARYLAHLTQAHPETVPYDQTSFAEGKLFLTQANLQSGNL